jgi:hypothetical protein
MATGRGMYGSPYGEEGIKADAIRCEHRRTCDERSRTSREHARRTVRSNP